MKYYYFYYKLAIDFLFNEFYLISNINMLRSSKEPLHQESIDSVGGYSL